MRKARIVGIGFGIALGAGLVGSLWWRDAPAPERAFAPPPAVSAAPAPATASLGDTAAVQPAPGRPLAAPETTAAEDAEDGGFERALRWSQVDLEAIRSALPENRYWETSAPTDDPALLEARERERARWNEAYGQVLAGHASEADIDAYFAHRQAVSSDAIEFADLLLERHRDVLPDQDVGLLELAIRMHHKRLQELPRAQAEAIERKRAKDALRDAWRRDEARFAAPPAEALE